MHKVKSSSWTVIMVLAGTVTEAVRVILLIDVPIALQAGTIVGIQRGAFHAECVSARQALVVIQNIVIDNFAKHRACRAAYGSTNKSSYNCSGNGADSGSNGAGNQSSSSSCVNLCDLWPLPVRAES
jgi:hypothetical protein